MGILEEYSFPVIDPTKPAFKAQKLSCAVMVGELRDYNLNDLGTGKTRCALWSFDYLRKKELARKMLVACPLSTMNRVWESEISLQFTDISCAIVHGSNKERRLRELRRDVDVYIINHDGLVTIFSELMALKNIDVICFDESAVFRNPSNRTKAAKMLAHNKKYVWGMTGSPMPRHPTDVWGQCIVITPNTVPKYFSHIRNALMIRGPRGHWDWQPRPDAEKMAVNYMKPSVRFTLNDIIELPPKVLHYYEVRLSSLQYKVYEDIRNKAVAIIERGNETKQVVALNAGAALQKLIQIACGYVYASKTKEIIPLDNTDRLQTTLDLIDSTSRKVIVYVPYLSALEGVSTMLKANKVDHAIVHGGVTKTHRNLIFSAFQDTPKYKVLLAHPVCMSHGLTLTAANTIIWFGPTLSLDTFYQANGRITRVGQEHKQLIAMLGGTRMEKRIYDILAENERTQKHFLDLIKEATDQQMAAA
jgi:SNF2 family DNA or RNA helicase